MEHPEEKECTICGYTYVDGDDGKGDKCESCLNKIESPVFKEYQRAKQEGRQPNCPFCEKPLEITQTQYTDIYWRWDSHEKRFAKDDSGGDADKPYCVNCETYNWDFIDFDLIDF